LAGNYSEHIKEAALKRSRSIVEHAREGDWIAVRQEWNGVLPDVENGMKELQSEELSQLVSLGGWLRGTQALTALVLQNYSPENAALLRQPVLLGSFAKHLEAMSHRLQAKPIVITMKGGLRNVQPFIAGEAEAPSKSEVEETAKICAKLLERLKASA
jgi:N-acetylglucosamine kinase-like BadF-type ATPase